MKIVETEVFLFGELSDNAKEKAREWYREGGLNYEWYDSVLDDAYAVGAILGFDIDKGPRGIRFSGFYSQGDGASFTGGWRIPKAPVKAMKAHAPKDKELHAMARDAWAIVQSLTKDEREDLPWVISQSGYYVHHKTMTCDNGPVQDLARDFAQWIYRSLEREWDYMNADEQVDESIIANEYTFTVDGRRFG